MKMSFRLTITIFLFLQAANGFVINHKSHREIRQHSMGPSRLKASDCAFDHALIFDCDGVIIETEELHRLAYNAAFKAADLQIDNEPVEWTVEYYDILQNTVGGGKNKMFYHFRNVTKTFPVSGDKSAPTTAEEEQALVDDLQDHKTELYKDLIKEKAIPRPGVIELMDEALADPKIAVGVCSASTKAAVTKVLDVTLGEDRRKKLDVCILGDDVSKLKPDPLIYVTAAERLNINPECCVVIEDSLVGLKAAKGAGMKCVITYTSSTEGEDFYGLGADAKIPELGSRKVGLDSIFAPLKEDINAEILIGIKDD
jgi:HAD superfamily hydrolase (TIGR01509 family)